MELREGADKQQCDLSPLPSAVSRVCRMATLQTCLSAQAAQGPQVGDCVVSWRVETRSLVPCLPGP